MKRPDAAVRLRPRDVARAGPRARLRARAGGFTFLGLMFLIMVMGLMAAAAASTWSFTGQRDKEEQLLFVGHEYRVALARYALAHAHDPQPWPTALDKLLGSDADRLAPQRFLRKLYVDPMTGRFDWALMRNAQGGIIGVHSLSTRTPIRRKALDPGNVVAFEQARSYQEWIFTASGGAAPVEPATRGRRVVPGWDYARDGEPPLTWEDAPPAPMVVPVEPN